MADTITEYRNLITSAAAKAREIFESIRIGKYYKFASEQKTLCICVSNKTLTGGNESGYDMSLTGSYYLVNNETKSIEAKKNGTINNILQSNTINPADDYSSFTEISAADMKSFIEGSYSVIM